MVTSIVAEPSAPRNPAGGAYPRRVPRSAHAWVLLVLVGCTRTLPAYFTDDDRHARVYRAPGREPGPPASPLAPPREALPTRGLSLVAEWGDDRQRYDDRYHDGPTLTDRRRVLWSATALLLVDSDGAPNRLARWSLPTDVWPSRIAVDPRGRWIAVLDTRGGYHVGALGGGELAALAPAPRAPSAADTPATAVEPRVDVAGSSTRPWHGGSGETSWPPARISERLFFSPDGERLVGGESVWEVATRRPLLTLAVDEALLGVDADLTRAAVARLVERTEHGRPGSQCGFIPTWHSLVVTHAESRDLRASAPPRELTVSSWQEAVPGFDEPPAVRDALLPYHPVTQVAVDAGGPVAVAIGGNAWRLTERGAAPLGWPRAMREVHGMTFAAGGLVVQSTLDAAGRYTPASGLYRADGAADRLLAGGLQGPPSRDGLAVLDDEGWSVWDLVHLHRVRELPDPGRLNLSSIEQGRLSDAGVAVLREETSRDFVFLVEQGEAWRRVAVPKQGRSFGRWWLAPDGRHVAMWITGHLALLDLADGRVRWEGEVAGQDVSVALANDRVWVGDLHGVRGLSLDGEELARVDLDGRFDRPTALALGRDGATLAVGTARSRVFVFRAQP